MYVICSDLEGVFVPEIWVSVSKQTGIDELKLTTREISDYNFLMKRRLEILREHGLKLQDLQKIISHLEPFPGAKDFVDWVRTVAQMTVVSDTYIEMAVPLVAQLGRPTLFCHDLTVDPEGNITDYNLRQKDAKKMVVNAMHSLNYKVIAIGDSYNDIAMLRQSEFGILFNPPKNVMDENKDLKVVWSYKELKETISGLLGKEK
jgi:phosphoserine / homoserine phosphotransferase